MEKRARYLDLGVKGFSIIFFIVTLAFMFVAFSKQGTVGEADYGDFTYIDFNSGWSAQVNGETFDVTLPTKIDCKSGDTIVLTNTLPDDVNDGMTLMTRSELSDVYYYIDDELRSSYTSDGFANISKYLPSEYVAARLYDADAGKIVTIRVVPRNDGTLNGVTLSHGNNAWFRIIIGNLALTVIALVVALLGLLVAIFAVILSKRLHLNKSIIYLGMLMCMMGVWLLSESKLRQLIFLTPSLTSYFSYFSVEVLSLFALMYFDEVQHRNYHKLYIALETAVSLQIVANMLLKMTGVMEYYQSIIFSHMWMLLAILSAFVTIGIDTIHKVVDEYKVAAIGMGTFLTFCLFEVVNFYVSSFRSFGTFICIGLLVLLFATIIQIMVDTSKQVHIRELNQRKSMIGTIETIESAIDAKDEYTGGHSNRVGEYAAILASKMAPQYGFSALDVMQIRYIGLMHDIGKIGVADTILNKSGKLTDEEFSLMKKHVEIGYDLLASMDSSLDGLLDGIKYHHERYDGKGYPDGLAGEDIPLIARILCLADCYDAMTSNRVYRRRLTDEEVREEIVKCSGTQFDPKLAAIFVEAIDDGDMKPSTYKGMEVNHRGRALKSSLLEERLQKDVEMSQERVLNPSHVRMVSYIIKLAEKNGRVFDVMFLSYLDDSIAGGYSKDYIDKLLKNNVHGKDICIDYTNQQKIIVLFDYKKEEIDTIYNILLTYADVEKLT